MITARSALTIRYQQKPIGLLALCIGLTLLALHRFSIGHESPADPEGRTYRHSKHFYTETQQDSGDSVCPRPWL